MRVKNRHYGGRDFVALGDYYLRNTNAMTAEGLHAKSDIAAELAHRDMQIDALKARCDKLEVAVREALILLADYVETDSPLPTQRSARVIRKLRSVVDGSDDE